MVDQLVTLAEIQGDLRLQVLLPFGVGHLVNTAEITVYFEDVCIF